MILENMSGVFGVDNRLCCLGVNWLHKKVLSALPEEKRRFVSINESEGPHRVIFCVFKYERKL